MLVGLRPTAPRPAIPSGGRPPGPPRTRFRARSDRFSVLTGGPEYHSSPRSHSHPRRCGRAVSRLSWLWQPVQRTSNPTTPPHRLSWLPQPRHSPTAKQRLIRDTANRGERWRASPVTYPGSRRLLLGPRALYDRRYGLAPVSAGRPGRGFCRIQIPGTLRAGAQVGPDPGRVDAAPWIHRISYPGSGAGSGLGGGRT